MHTPTLARSTLLLALAACSLGPKTLGTSDSDTAGDGTSSTADATSIGGTTSAGSATATTTTGIATTTTTGATTGGVDTTSSAGSSSGGPPQPCSTFAQDCPEGQKCNPYSPSGNGGWEEAKCVPVVPNPDGLYEPCKVLNGPFGGEDTCDKPLLCFNADENGNGVCWGQCIGSLMDPQCTDPNAQCQLGRTALNLCVPTNCDPLIQDCSDVEACIPDPNGTGFFCTLDASGDAGALHTPCESANACDPGLFCGDPALAAECDPMAPGCCLAFCDLVAPSCLGKMQQCVPWFPPGTAPPGLENVGKCVLP